MSQPISLYSNIVFHFISDVSISNYPIYPQDAPVPVFSDTVSARMITPGGTAHDTVEPLQTDPKPKIRETLPEGWEMKEYSSNPGHFYFFNTSLELSIKNPPQSDDGQEEIRNARESK